MSRPRPTHGFTESLNEHRRELDAIDAQLVSLLAARYAVTRRIGALKAAHNVAAADPAREQAQLERLLALSGQLDLPADLTRAIYDSLFRFVRESHRTQAASARVGIAEAESKR
ncbi:MAG TPA: chorismate mutase [Polyangiaceae bacterium]|nr:chorismate mutase [Polyangiaceae bacterium]